MSAQYIVNGQVYIDHRFQRKTVAMEQGKLRLLPPDTPVDGETFDAAEKRVVPGFIDIHTHGAVGVDMNSAAAPDLEKIARFFAGNGTTSFLASILTDTEEQTGWCLEQCRDYRTGRHDGAELLGVHLEGPFLASAYKGAMPEYLLRSGNKTLLRSYQELAGGCVLYLTVSPEVEGVLELIPAARELGIVVAIGHSGADYETAMAAIDAGAASATHTFNVMQLLHQHRPAILGAVLESEVYCEAICDGRHLHPGIVRLLLKVKGLDRVVAITDSIMAAGLPDGKYHLGVNEVVVEDGDAKLVSDGARAGSTLTQNLALHNLLLWTGRSLEELLPLLTENPARLIGLFDRKGSIADGKDADLLVLGPDAQVETVFLRGKRFRPD